MKKYIIKPLAKVEENDLEGYAVEFAPDTITEAEHRKGLEYIGNCLDSKGVGAWNKGKKHLWYLKIVAILLISQLN